MSCSISDSMELFIIVNAAAFESWDAAPEVEGLGLWSLPPLAVPGVRRSDTPSRP